VDLGRGRSNFAHREHLRKTLGLPRDPPTGPIRQVLGFQGMSQPIVHFWADHADGLVTDPAALAEAMAAALSPREAIELVSSMLPLDAPYEGAFTPPVPEGGAPSGKGRLVWKNVGFMALREAYRVVWEREGWELLEEQRTSVNWKGMLHRRGEMARASIEHDWNSGDPKLDEVTFAVVGYHDLEPTFVRAACHRVGFWEALCEAARDDTDGDHERPHIRMAILAAVARGAPPPVSLDGTARTLQQAWCYAQPLFQAYAKLLPAERRESLLIETLAEGDFAFELFELAPTARVLDAIWPRFEAELAFVLRFEDNAFGRQEERALASLLGPRAGPKLRALAAGTTLKPQLKKRVARLSDLVEDLLEKHV
jgi:hypothetical protein